MLYETHENGSQERLYFILSHLSCLDHLRIQMFSLPNMGKKSSDILQHHFLELWVDFLLPERLVSNLHLISFYVQRNLFVKAICDHPRKLKMQESI